MSTDNLRIIRLEAENFMRLVAVSITPTGDMVELTGRNRQGKTSVLDAIWSALGGKDATPDVPIRRPKKGSAEEAPTSASVTLELGTDGKTRLVVTRRFTERGTTLTIRNADGAQYPKPQEMLDKLIGSLSMDPMEFLGQKPKDQAETLRRLVGLDTSKLDEERKRLFEARTLVNRDVALRTGEVDGIRLLDAPEPVDVAELLAEQEASMRQSQRRQEQIRILVIGKENIARALNEIATVELEIGRMREKLRDHTATLAVLNDAVGDLEAEPEIEVPDQDEIRARIAAAGEINQLAAAAEAAARQKAQAEAKLKAAKFESDSLTDMLKALDKARAKLIAACKMPLEGLTIEEGVVLFGGIPLSQASDAEQRQISLAIAMAQNPQLRVIRIRDGSLLDQDARQDVAAFASEHDLQVWMETVQSGNPAAIVIEDGHVQAYEGSEAG